jgi:ATP-dependent exoDNAse (exonuclease V) beta subunit
MMRRERGGWRQLVVDRSFVDAEEQRWIIDYKTSQPRADETADSFVARELALYQMQLKAYRDAVAEWESRAIRTALYFPALPRLVEVEL